MKQSKMTKEELEKKWLGKRVAVYDANKFRRVGKVIGADGVFLKIILQGNENMYDTFHPKQCRLLKKRERRRVWVYFDDDGSVYHTVSRPTATYTEFIEVKRPRRD